MSEKLSVDKIIEIMKQESNEQKQIIEFLEKEEDLECYIAPHRKAMNECNHIVEYLEELKKLRGAMERIISRLEEELPLYVGKAISIVKEAGGIE